jgi:hypothetical protein
MLVEGSTQHAIRIFLADEAEHSPRHSGQPIHPDDVFAAQANTKAASIETCECGFHKA